ncbi:hypothetical protein HPB48_020764 [Haemaphysalis longicornis]|uniref:Uncharacterized protein n=1 Tax=Haemaphysalis longicornis TaxID=44386 RepID=A0A9J6H4Q1_HAELO|nr:hypothetical protein HPB48_020764 [Haemaphysalis longicornis]
MQTALQGSIDTVIQSQKTLESTVNEKRSQIDDTLVTIACHTEEIAELKYEVLSLQKIIATQQKKLDDLENRSRRSNVVIFALSEQKDETPADLRERVLSEVFHTKLGVATSVERVHRIGKKSTNKPRPVMLNFFDYNEKMLIMQNCKKLKASPISITNDFCKATLVKRSKLWLHAKQFKDEGCKMAFDYDRLRVDNDVYTWDEENARPLFLRQQKQDNQEAASSCNR